MLARASTCCANVCVCACACGGACVSAVPRMWPVRACVWKLVRCVGVAWCAPRTYRCVRCGVWGGGGRVAKVGGGGCELGVVPFLG